MQPNLKWVWIGLSRTVAAFSLLSLLFGEMWARGWLAWFLKHWAEVMHQFWMHLPFHLYLNSGRERALALYIVLLGILGAEMCLGGAPIRSLQKSYERIGLGRHALSFVMFALIVFIPSLILVDVNAFYPGQFSKLVEQVDFWFGVFMIVSWALLFGTRASLVTAGFAAALLILNYGANIFGIAPPPSK